MGKSFLVFLFRYLRDRKRYTGFQPLEVIFLLCGHKREDDGADYKDEGGAEAGVVAAGDFIEDGEPDRGEHRDSAHICRVGGKSESHEHNRDAYKENGAHVRAANNIMLCKEREKLLFAVKFKPSAS